MHRNGRVVTECYKSFSKSVTYIYVYDFVEYFIRTFLRQWLVKACRKRFWSVLSGFLHRLIHRKCAQQKIVQCVNELRKLEKPVTRTAPAGVVPSFIGDLFMAHTLCQKPFLDYTSQISVLKQKHLIFEKM